VQLGSFSRLENAQQLRDRIVKNFDDVTITPLQSKETTYYRVQLGNFSNRKAAEDMAKQLSQAGYSVIVMEK
jgi:cell division septation protein DedD